MICGDLLRAVAEPGQILTHDAELHRVADRRTVFQADHAQAQVRPGGIRGRKGFLQLLLQRLPFVQAFGDNHQLAEIVIEQLLIQRQEETRRTVADIG